MRKFFMKINRKGKKHDRGFFNALTGAVTGNVKGLGMILAGLNEMLHQNLARRNTVTTKRPQRRNVNRTSL